MGDTIVPQQRLLRHLCRKSKPLKGDKILLELVYHPDQLIHSSQLNNLFNEQGRGKQEFADMANPDEESLINIGFGWCELPIEITDKRTLTECRKRLRQLAQEEEELEDWNDFGRLQDIRDEKQQILEFIKLCVSSSGKIKSLFNKQYNDYQAILKTLNRSIEKIGLSEPDLVPYIREHLVIGVYCQWKEAM